MQNTVSLSRNVVMELFKTYSLSTGTQYFGYFCITRLTTNGVSFTSLEDTRENASPQIWFSRRDCEYYSIGQLRIGNDRSQAEWVSSARMSRCQWSTSGSIYVSIPPFPSLLLPLITLHPPSIQHFQ